MMLLLRLLTGLWFENKARPTSMLLLRVLAGLWLDNKTRPSSLLLLRLLAGLDPTTHSVAAAAADRVVV